MTQKSRVYFYWKCLFLICLLIGIAVSITFPFSDAYATRAYWTDLEGVQFTSIQVKKGNTIHLILKAEVPSEKTLYAYNIEALFDANLVKVVDAKAPSGSAFPPINIHKGIPGKVIINAFSVTGVAGPATISFLDLTLNAEAEGSFILDIKVNTYGSSPDDQFRPIPETAIIVIIPPPPIIGWFDPSTGKMVTNAQICLNKDSNLILKADIPQEKTLNAYNIMITYDPNLASLVEAKAAVGSPFPPHFINPNIPGKVIINGFSVTGVSGHATISLLDLTLKGKAKGAFSLSITVNSYGSDAADQFPPAPQNAVIDIIDNDGDGDCYYLKINTIPQSIDSTTVNPEKTCSASHSYTQNTLVTLTANAVNTCYTFAHWQGDATGSNNLIQIMMDGNKAVTAVFESLQYSLNTHVSPEGSGIVTINPIKALYNCGDVIKLTAQPLSGYSFDHWERYDDTNHVCSANSLSITMDRNKFVTAVFKKPPFLYTTTPLAMFLWGYITIDGKPADPGDWIGIFAPGVETNGGCIGAVEINDPNGLYGVVAAYGDDSSTIIKEGALNGERLSFKAWDKSKGEYVNLFPEGPDEPTWESNNLFHINLISTSQQRIPLCKGWNLISFQIKKCIYDKCFYKEDVPESKRIDANQIEFEGKSCLVDWFNNDANSPIRDQSDPNKAGDWQRITSFDESGAHIMDKNLPSFINTLHYLSIGYGYWIKMNEPGILIADGQMADSNISLNLSNGWNLIGPVQPDICYASDTKLKEDICPYKTGVYLAEENILCCPIDPFPALTLVSILNKYRRITSFDCCNGAMLYDTQIPPQVNTLHYIGPKYGYWIKMLDDAKLTFPDGCPE